MDLIDQQRWDKAYSNLEFSEIPSDNPIRQWIERHFSKADGAGKTCIEIGCFPGGFLALFGAKGYRLEGIDLTPRVSRDLPAWLESQNCPVGEFHCRDFRGFRPAKQYDVVCSFGFIEHFLDWEAILEKQCDLVKEGGFLVLETPNFKGGWQRLLHKVFDEEALERHNLAAMDPDSWQTIVEKHGFDLQYKGHFGTFRFWYGEQERNRLQQLLLDAIGRLAPWLDRVLPANRPGYAPFCGLIGRKRLREAYQQYR